MRTLAAAAMVLALVSACGSEATPTSEPIPIFDPVYQTFMVSSLEQEILMAKQEGNDALVECLTVIQEAYIHWQPVEDDVEERCEPLLGAHASATPETP